MYHKAKLNFKWECSISTDASIELPLPLIFIPCSNSVDLESLMTVSGVSMYILQLFYVTAMHCLVVMILLIR